MGYTDDAEGRAREAANNAIADASAYQDLIGDNPTPEQLATLHAKWGTIAKAQTHFYQVSVDKHIKKPEVRGVVSTQKPTAGDPILHAPPLRSNIAPIITGEPITTFILTGIASIFSIFGLFGGGDWKKPFRKLSEALTDIANTLMNFIWSIWHSLRWVLNALRFLWERILKPLIDHINAITQRIAAIIEKVLRPYLQLIDHIRKQILAIYRRFFLPVIAFLQKVRQLIALLRLLHVPGMKALDQKIARIEGKLIGVIQAILYRVNDHSGLLNLVLTARATIQHGILIRSLYETQGAWVNEWWNSQAWDREPADAEAGVQLDLAIESQPHIAALDILLKAGVSAGATDSLPHERELDTLLTQGAA